MHEPASFIHGLGEVVRFSDLGRIGNPSYAVAKSDTTTGHLNQKFGIGFPSLAWARRPRVIGLIELDSVRTLPSQRTNWQTPGW